MNKIMFCLLLGLITLTQLVHAAPSFELISNTDQCLVNCEGVLKMVTDNSIIAPLPIKENTNFKMEFIKGENANDILEYSIELGTKETYYVTEPVFSTKKEKRIIDYNASGCPTGFSLEQSKCEKEVTVRYKSGDKQIEKTRIIYKDFFSGITLLPNSEYYIRIRAKKQPKIGPNDIDWILTIFGIKLDQYAWALSNWAKRECFTITNDSGTNVTTGFVMDVNSDDFNYAAKCTETTNFYDCMGGLVYNGSSILLTMEAIDNNKSWFKLQANLNNGDTTPSGEAGYCQYYDNVSATEPTTTTNFLAPAVDFNSSISGDTNETAGLYHLENNLSDSSRHLRDGTIVGGWSGYSDSNAQYGQVGAGSFTDAQHFTLPLGNVPVGTIEFWFRDPLLDTAVDIGSPLSTSARQLEIQIKSAVAAPYTNSMHILTIGGPAFNLDCDIVANQWYHFAFTWNGTDVNAYLDGVLCDSAEVAWTISDTSITVGRITGTPGYAFLGALDELRISTYAKTSFPAAARPNQVNFTKSFAAAEVPAATFETINFYPCGGPYVGASFDLNIASDLNIQVDLNISGNDQNIDSLKLFTTITHKGDDDNSLGFDKLTELKGWKQHDEVTWEIIDDTDHNRVRSSCIDDYAFKAISANLEMDDFLTSDGNFTLNSSNDWLKVHVSKVGHDRTDLGTDANMFYNISFLAQYTGAANKNLTIFDCNSSVATPISSENCATFQIPGNTATEDDTYFSILEIIDDQNQLVGVKLDSDQNHYYYLQCPQCSINNHWDIFYRDINSNSPDTRNWTSSTGVGNLVATDKTIQLHTHWQNLSIDHNFALIVQHTDLSSTDVNSDILIERIEGENLPPIVREIINPTIGSILTGIVDLNVLVNDPNGDTIVVDINLLDSTGADVNNLGFGLNVFDNNNAGLDFNTLAYDDGTYSLAIRVRETVTTELFETDFNMDGTFQIDNINLSPTVVVNYPNGGEEFETTATMIITIGIKITDPDSNSFLVDLNYDTGNSEGSGIVLIDDVNTETATIDCLSGTFHEGRDCNVSWNIVGVADGNYYVLALVTDNFSNTSFDASDATFQITTLPDDSKIYVKRYINPRTQNDFTDFEKAQLASQKQTESLIFSIFVIILIVVIVVGITVVRRK